MISIQLDVGQDEIEDAMVDMGEDELVGMIVSVMERFGVPRVVKSLIGQLGDTYTYLEETFGE